jgi:hypothetical protein
MQFLTNLTGGFASRQFSNRQAQHGGWGTAALHAVTFQPPTALVQAAQKPRL